jgi:hypothetical protein
LGKAARLGLVMAHEKARQNDRDVASHLDSLALQKSLLCLLVHVVPPQVDLRK